MCFSKTMNAGRRFRKWKADNPFCSYRLQQTIKHFPEWKQEAADSLPSSIRRAPILIDERPPAIHRTGSSAGVVHRTDRRRRSGSGAILKISMSPGFLVFWFFEIRAAPAPGVVHAAEQTRNRPGAIRSLWFIGSSIGRSASRQRRSSY